MNNTKTVLITGATSGIGEALVQKYAEQNYHVIACGRNQQKLALLVQKHPQLTPLTFDINNHNDIALAANSLPENLTLDVVILNAGDCQYIDNAKQFNGQVFADIIATNLQALGWLLQYFLPKVATNGQLVFISSSATLLPFPRAEAYGASKAGVDYLANSLRLDLKQENIAVTLVQPGFIKTPLTAKNNFSMPFMLTSENAATRIFKGIQAKKNTVHFPKRLTLLLKFIALLPAGVWQWLILRNSSL